MGQSSISVEEWRDYAGLYKVSSHGRVWSMRSGKELSPSVGTSGYPHVVLYLDEGRVTRGIHRMVLEAFVGPCPTGMEGCHEDGNKLNNRLGNLRWDTPKGNHADMDRRGTRFKALNLRNGNAKLDADQKGAIKYAAAHGVRVDWLAKQYKVSERHVRRLISQ